VVAVLVFVVGIALLAYVRGAAAAAQPLDTPKTNQAVAEAYAMSSEWYALAYGCYLQMLDITQCASNAALGFNEPAGQYWNWTSQSVDGVAGASYVVGSRDGGVVVRAYWSSRNAGLENGETYVVDLQITKENRPVVTRACLPKAC